MNWQQFCGCDAAVQANCLFNITAVYKNDLSPCLQMLLQAAVSALLFLVSVSYVFNFFGYKHSRVSPISPVHYISIFRAWSCVFIAFSTLALGLIQTDEFDGANKVGSVVYYITLFITAIAWLVLGLMFFSARYRFPLYKRGPVVVIIVYLLNLAVFAKSLQTYWVSSPVTDYHSTIVLLYGVATVSHVFLVTALVPSGVQYPTHLSVNIQTEGSETESLITGTNDVSYRTFTAQQATTRGEDGNILSRLFFWWVQPLMKRGKLGFIQTADDVFLLPKSLDTQKVASKFYSNLCQAQQDHQVNGKPLNTLMAALHRTFGLEYYALGVMKLLADGLGFAGPLLLNALISYMENPSEVVWHGYMYAAGLFASTLAASLLTAHFDYLVKKIGIKFSSGIISCVYKKMLSVSTVELSHFTTGETVNFMSTDVDRTVNFCTSFHQFWSLPFQIGVSLFLLYQQVGWSFLAGVAFAIVLIPVNRKIAIKIGDLSSKMMSQKDCRVQTMNEMIFGIRVIKLFCWEDYFVDRVNRQRSAELSSLKARKYLDALCVYFWATTPVIISILTFTTYSLLGNELTAAKVFTSLALFNMLIGPLNAFPWVVNGLVEAWVSVKRVQQFVDLNSSLQSHFWSGEDGSVTIDTSSFSWRFADTEAKEQQQIEATEQQQTERHSSGASNFILKDINLCLQKGDLIGVVGSVGSGKTSLLMSILNEMRILEPNGSHDSKVRIGSSSGIGLVSQQPWIQQGTLRENILMGKSFDWSAYQAAVAASALADDLKNLADGDKTKVGENGVTLSGGQRARLTLARAIYQDFDIYLLDDPLSAVDAKVARHIFYECILSGMKDKLRILCTHHISYLYEADTVIVMEDGKIVACGPPSDVLPVYTSSIHTSLPSASSVTEGSTSKVPSEDPHTVEDSKGQQAEATDNEEGGGAIVEEEKDSGTVKLHIYRMYLAAVGTALSLTILLSLLLMQGSKNVTDWWLSYWISNAPDSSADLSSNVSSNVTFYLEVYGGLAVGNTIFTLFRAFVFAYGGLCAAARLHDKLLGVVTLAPVSFFDTTSTGRIINRFSSDVYAVDDSLPFIANILLSQIFSIIGTLVITIYGLPWFAAVVFPITLVYYYIQGYYRHTSRELKRITSVTMSEVYSSLSESVEGRVVIRAFNMNSQYELENLSRIERNQRANFSATAAAQWLNIRLQGLGVVMVTAIALIAVLEHRYYTVNAGLVGLAISYALSITNLLSGVVSSFTETEKQMVSVERINQYIEKINLHSETNSVTAEHDWPQAGRIEFKDVSLRYRSDLPLVLNSLTVAIQPAEKIGIVGRTGSGKSSLLNIIFNMVDEFTGRVLIDGVDIRQLTVKTLRSHLAIIPQTPFLFSGTIRDNLDPTVRHSDTELWEVLSKCRLKSQVSALGGLSASLAERGKLFSVGESQLLCLARAMLLRSKVLCIDEATANVDLQTDSLIQETIREEFQSCTVLTIAHRVSTVLQCDRIMVMSRGRLVEFGVPEKLLANPESQLSSIVNQHSE